MANLIGLGRDMRIQEWLVVTIILFLCVCQEVSSGAATMSRHRVYLVTGANSGLGLEATRQIIRLEADAKIYLLCRSEQRAKRAMMELGSSKNLAFLPFDSNDPASTMIDNLSSISEEFIDGILLNAGGFGDGANPNEKIAAAGGSSTARLNLIAHAALVKHLLSQGKIKTGTRIVAAGSEGCFATPGFHLDWAKADLKAHLSGDVRSAGPGLPYIWTKGILALYWAAFARRHNTPDNNEDLYVVTVSPGSVTTTNFYQHGGATPVLKFFARLTSICMGSRSLEDGAKRFTDALLDTEDFDGNTPSGSFLAHRAGFSKDYGDVTQMKRGVVFGDATQQDRAWEAVESFLN